MQSRIIGGTGCVVPDWGLTLLLLLTFDTKHVQAGRSLRSLYVCISQSPQAAQSFMSRR